MRIAIIGAGAAGCFAAANIPFLPGREVIVFEKTNKVLQKVKVSGGGRCNVTHACFDIAELIEHYPRGQRFLKKTLYGFTPQDTIDWFGSRGVVLKTEDDGRMFPVTDESQAVIDCLWQQMIANKVQVRYGKQVQKITVSSGTLTMTIHFADGTSYTADKVLVACGGFPKAEQYHWIESLGHTVQLPVPSLFTFNVPKHPITQLMGISVSGVTVKIAGTKIAEQGPILITHWGFSGPVVLRCSAWGARQLNDVGYKFTILVNWLGSKSREQLQEDIKQLREQHGRQHVLNKNPFNLPKRLWQYFCEKCGINEHVNWGTLAASAQNKLINTLVADEYHVSGKTTFKEEFVTAGGVTLSEIDPKTMESRVVRGVYFAGEIMDVDGITGGFNFQHAWSSGYIAAQGMAKTKINT